MNLLPLCIGLTAVVLLQLVIIALYEKAHARSKRATEAMKDALVSVASVLEELYAQTSAAGLPYTNEARHRIGTIIGQVKKIEVLMEGAPEKTTTQKGNGKWPFTSDGKVQP